VGEVVDRVPCLHDAAQTYALFLPSTYCDDRTWPILYAFDPQARGRVPVQLFRQAAEHLAFIVVASNNSRNGPMPPVVAAMDAVWRDTHARLAIDPERVYAAGMSGGTLPALLLGTAFGSGVIACAGAGDVCHIPPTDRRFVWLGIAGDADFNFDRGKRLVEALVAQGVTARCATFAGGHGWPPEDVAARALEWLDLSAMRAGRRDRDEARLDALHAQGLARARGARRKEEGPGRAQARPHAGVR
jgi:dienelactone hydrolase